MIDIDISRVEAEVLAGTTPTKAAEGLAALRALPCTTDEEYNTAVALLKSCKLQYKQRENRRKEITGPLNKAKRDVDSLFKPGLLALAEAEKVLKEKVRTYQEQAAQRALKAREEVKEAHERGDYGAVVKASQAMAPVPVAEGVYKTTRKVVEVSDFSTLPDEFKSPNMPAIRKAIKEGRKIPGVSVVIQEGVGVRT